MAEHKRTKNPHSGDTYQWVDADRCMVLDAVTGQPERFGDACNSIGSFDEALDYVGNRPGWESRMVIVKLPCICGFIVDA